MVAVRAGSKGKLKIVGAGLVQEPEHGAETGGSSSSTKEYQVAEILREMIFTGVLGRGQKLKQAKIAEMLDTSITPVRAALKLLEAQGYVRLLAHRGAVVAPFQISEVDELFQLRVHLEANLTQTAAEHVTPGDIQMLTDLNADLGRAVESNSRELIRASNFRFHFRLYELANLPQTLEFVRILWAKYPFDLLGSVPRVSEYATNEHAVIIEALKARDPRAARRAMHAHIELGHRAFSTSYNFGKPR